MAGYVYIVENDRMPGIIKIGMTEGDLKGRIDALFDTSVPVPFTCVYAARVENPKSVESALHDAFGDKRVHPGREFFEVAPTRVIAALRLCPHEDATLPDVPATDDYNPGKQKRSRTRLSDLGIPIGAQLTHIDDEKEIAVVTNLNPDRITYEGEDGEVEVGTLSPIASKIHKKRYPNANDALQGAAYWQYQGKTLWDLRIEMERALASEDS